MKKSKSTETDNTDSNTETEEGLVTNTLGRISDRKVGNSPSVSVTSEEVAR